MSGSGSGSPSLSPSPSLQNLLIEEVAQLRGFLVLLESEQKALIGGDVEQLLALAAEKTEFFGRLTKLGEARAQALASAGFAAGGQGMESWFARYPDASGARRDWQDLRALAKTANSLNNTNGDLIATRLAHNQQALSALMSAANQASLYGPDGQAQPVGGGRSLGSV